MQEQRDCQQCQATCKNRTAQCRRRTCKIADYCWQHLRSVCHLQVKQSNIRGAGLGLFTTNDIRVPRNGTKRIVKYASDSPFMRRVSANAIDAEYGDKLGVYVWCKNAKTCYDAKSTQATNARRANACDRPGHRVRCNAKINHGGWLVATKNIPAGSEIYTPYGRAYWQ